MKIRECSLFGISDAKGRVHLTYAFCIMGPLTVGQISYCGLESTLRRRSCSRRGLESAHAGSA